MTQISRPFQIALAAMVLLAAVWFVALRGHSSGTESSGSAASSSAPPATPQQTPASSSGSSSGGSSGSSSSPSSTYHGSAPGVAGLTRAIAKAHGAVAQSEQNARRLAQKSQQAAGSGSTQASSPSAPKATAKAASPSVTHTKVTPAAAPRTHAAAPAAKTPANAPTAKAHAKNGFPAMQLKVEGELKHGKVAAILFWNPKGSVDAVVRRELQAAGRTSGGKLAVHIAPSGQVGDFGTFTRAVQVYSTPTILLVNSKGLTSSVTGLTDAFSIEQAVKEVKLAR